MNIKMEIVKNYFHFLLHRKLQKKFLEQQGLSYISLCDYEVICISGEATFLIYKIKLEIF